MICQQCEREYHMLVMIPDDTWHRICPEDGFLCLECMEKRLRAMGLQTVATISYKNDVIDATDKTAFLRAVEATYTRTAREVAIQVSQENQLLKAEIQRLASG